ncbi:MAG: ATP-binding protein [Candidatus Neomarinimicrobiota bacterium]
MKKRKNNQLYSFFKDITDRKKPEEEEQLQDNEQELMASNESLIESEKQFRELFENMEQGFALHEMIYDKNGTPIDYRFVLINKAFNKLTGIDASHYIGKTAKQVLPEIEQIWIDNYGKVAKTGKSLHFEHYSTEFGKYYNVTAYSPKKNYFATVFSDTTQDRLQNKQLLENQYYLSKAQEMGKIGTWELDILTNELFWTDEIYKMFNIPIGTPLTYKQFLNGIHPDDQNYLNERWAEALKKNNYDIEHRLLINGEVKWLREKAELEYDKQGKAIKAIGFAHDITTIKKTEAELIKAKEKAEESEAKVKLLNNLTSEMLRLQSVESIYTFIAEHLQKNYPNTIVLVVSIDEAIKQSRLEVVAGLDNSLLRKAIRISGINPIGKTYKLNEIHNSYFKSGHFVEFNGGLTEFSASEFPIFVTNAFEKLIGLHKIYTIGINKDDELLAAIHFFTFNKQVITDDNFIEVFVKQAGLILQKKINEKALKKAKEKAEENDRLKSAFLANMSHEIRTPMNGILGFTGLLKEPKLSTSEKDQFISIIENSGIRLLETVNDLIDFSKIEADQMKVSITKVNINELINKLYTFFTLEAQKKGLKLFLNTTGSTTNINLLSDKGKIYSILSNLIKNAIKYTQSGKIEFGYKKTENDLQFFVKDTGVGISKEKLEIIFDRFIRVGNDEEFFSEGSGLGLSITKAYVEMLGGKIWAKSEVGTGSQFYFTIPFKTANNMLSDNEATGAETKYQINPLVSGLKILIAEDDDTADELLSILIKNISKEILHTKSGLKAVELCRNNSDIDIILMDINMPEMNGYEATRKIREFNKKVIIIAQTAYALTGDHKKSLEAGCNAYISKPINKDELMALIQKYFK